MSLIILPAQPHHVEAIVQLLNEVTLDLHRKGIHQWNYPWIPMDIELDVTEGAVNLAIADTQIIGTYSLKDAVNQHFPTPDNSLYLYRIAISPALQVKKSDWKCPYINEENSTGCGACVLVCPGLTVQVVPRGEIRRS